MGQIRARCIRERKDIELVAVHDIDPAAAAAAGPAVTVCGSVEELLSTDLDAVFVCAFNNVAPDIVCAALESGHHVFCEKPPGRSVDDVRRVRVVEAAHPTLRLKYGFNHRYHGSVQEAKAMVESGRFGKVLWMRGVYGKAGGIQFENSWRNQSDLSGGGILLDQGVHMLDLFRLFCGDFSRVQSVVSTSFWDIAVEDNAFAILQTEAGQVATLHSSATQWKHRFALEICLQGGYINLYGLLTSTRSYGDETLTFAKRQFEDESFAVGKPREETIYFDRDDSWALELEDFVQAIRDDRPIASGSSEDALRVLQLIDDIYRVGRV